MEGIKALGYLALFQVTRRQGGTNSSRYRSNGSTPTPKKTNTQTTGTTGTSKSLPPEYRPADPEIVS